MTFLTHWGRVTHICVSKLKPIGSYNRLSPGRLQAIIWTSAGILLIRTLRKNVSAILSDIITFSFKKLYFKMSSGKWHEFCLGLSVLIGDMANQRTGQLFEWHEIDIWCFNFLAYLWMSWSYHHVVVLCNNSPHYEMIARPATVVCEQSTNVWCALYRRRVDHIVTITS